MTFIKEVPASILSLFMVKEILNLFTTYINQPLNPMAKILILAGHVYRHTIAPVVVALICILILTIIF